MKIQTIAACAILSVVACRANAQAFAVVDGAGMDAAIHTIADVVDQLRGYACATLNLTPEQMRDPSFDVPILASPSASSPRIGSAASIVFAKSPAHVENGFAEVMFPTGRPGWIAAKLLRPTPFSCSPVRTADGRVRIGR